MAKGKVNSAKPKEWTVDGFLDYFIRINNTMNDRSFTFLLGAGASITSGISDPGKLSNNTIQYLYNKKTKIENGERTKNQCNY